MGTLVQYYYLGSMKLLNTHKLIAFFKLVFNVCLFFNLCEKNRFLMLINSLRNFIFIWMKNTLSSFFVMHIYNTTFFRYIRKTFALAYNYVDPDLVLFLGDNLDEGEIATDEDFMLYLKRFQHIFREVDFNKVFNIALLQLSNYFILIFFYNLAILL